MNLYIDALIFKKSRAFGYQEFLFNLLDYFYENFNDFRYANIFILIPTSEIESFKKYDNKFYIKSFEIKSKFGHLKIQNTLNKYIKFEKNDVIWFTYNYSSLRKNCKHVLVVHDLLYLRKKFLPNFPIRLQRKISIPISLKKADKIIAISEYTKNDIIANYKTDVSKIEVIYNYFNFKKYKITDEYFKCDRPYFLSICSNAYHKNTISVLKSFEEFCKGNQIYDMVFIGALTDINSEACQYYQNLHNDIKKRIHLLTNVSNENLGMIYRNAKCFISLTLFEGLGMPIVEAMYFNLPIILSDLDVCREIATNENTFFVNPLDIKSISDKMHGIVGLKCHVNTKQYVLNKFSTINTSKKYITILNSIS